MSLVEMSLAGGLIILAAVLLRAAARDRLPVGAFEALWAMAWARLALPVRLPFRLSAWALVRRAVSRTAMPGPAPAAVVQPGLAAPQVVDIIPDAAQAALGRPFPTMTVLWAAGAAVCALAFALRYVRGCRRFRDAENIENSYVNQLLAERPLRRRVWVRASDRIGAPLTYGTARPVILLPRSMDLSDRETLGYVLTHELAHIRRFDAARKLALAGVVCLHWFNPLAWLMAALAGRDMERACDRAVVDAFGRGARRDYAMALLDMEERRGGSALSIGFAKNAIEERIHSIMKIRNKSFLSAVLAAALVLGVGAAFATAAPEAETPDEAVIGGAEAPTYIVESDDASTVLSGDVMASSDGTVYVFTAEGKPVSMTQQEYRALFEPVEVEWWTAEEYAAWLEQEKKDLQDCLGQRAWTNADGWFTWDQEKIDETIEMYEQVLAEIEDGLLVSRTVDGRADVSLTQGDGEVRDYLYSAEDGIVMYKYDGGDDGWTFRVMTEDEADALQEQNEAVTAERSQLEQQLAQLDQERAEIEQKLASMGEAEEQMEPEAETEDAAASPEEFPAEAVQPVQEADGTVTAPPNESFTVFFEQADGAPYGQIEGGGRVRLAGDVHAAAGNTVAVSLTTRTDASLTVSLHGDTTSMGRSVDLEAGEPQTVTFSPEQDDIFNIYLTNNSEYPVEFIASWVVS